MHYDEMEEDNSYSRIQLNATQKFLLGLFCVVGAAYIISITVAGNRYLAELSLNKEILHLPVEAVQDLLLALLGGLFVVGAAYGWYRETVDDPKYRWRQVNSYRRLFGSVLLALTDYTLKSIQFSKNVFYYPIGVDSRVFSKTYKKIEYTPSSTKHNPEWELKTITNAYCSPLKIWSGTLCLLTYMISIWVAHSVAKTFFPFISDIQSLKFYTIALAVSVLLCDIAIIRISTQLHVRELKGYRTTNTIKLLVIAFRGVIVISTASLLAFSFAIPFLESSLTGSLRDQEKQRILSKKSNIDLAAEREDMAIRLFYLQAKQFCAAYAFSGIKGAPTYSKDNWTRALATLPPADTISENQSRRSTPGDVSCAAYLRVDEPACLSATVGPACPNASRLAREVFLEAKELLGESEARANYDTGNVSRTIRLSAVGSVSLISQYKSKVAGLNAELDKVNDLTVTTSLDAYCQPQKVLSGLSVEKIWSYAKSIFVPAPFQCTPLAVGSVKTPRLDLNAAANTFFSQMSGIFGNAKGMLFVAVVVAILAMFELLVIVYKSFGQFPTLEGLKARMLFQYDEYLLGSKTLVDCPLVLSEMEFSTDWSIVDHLYHIAGDLIALCKSYMTTPLSSLLMLAAPGALLVYLIL